MREEIDKPIIVIGAGGHAKVLIDALRLMGCQVLGATEKKPEIIDQAKLPVKLLGNDDEILKHSPDSILLVNGVGQVGVGPSRSQIFDRYKSKGYRFAIIQHPRAVVAADVELHEGAQIMAGAIIQTASKIGCNTIVNTGASIDHDCQIESHVHIAPGAILCGMVEVGEGSHIGVGAILINNTKVPRNSFIKSGTLVK